MTVDAQSNVSPPPNRPSLRYYSMDFWRGVACLAVVFFHSTFYLTAHPDVPRPTDLIGKVIFFILERGHAGVPLFFVISGYCISAACMRHTGGVGGYFYRRFRRIYPPAWIWIFVSLVIFAAAAAMGATDKLLGIFKPMGDPRAMSFGAWIGNFTLTETWLSTISGREQDLLVGRYWTLCYEEQFYALCGLSLFLFKTPRKFFAAMLAISVAVIIAVIMGSSGEGAYSEGFFFDGRWLMFAAGVAVFYRIHNAPPRLAWLVDAALVASLGVVLAVSDHFHHTLAMLVSCSFALTLIWMWRIDKAFAAWRIIRPISWCGEMCYSLYLAHWPIVIIVARILFENGVRGLWPTVFITIPVCLAASLITARIFFILVERRFLNTRPPSVSGLASPTPTSSQPASTSSI